MMNTLIIKTDPPPPTYDPATRKLRARKLRFVFDGWPLIADTYEQARKEVALMGDQIDHVEPEH